MSPVDNLHGIPLSLLKELRNLLSESRLETIELSDGDHSIRLSRALTDALSLAPGDTPPTPNPQPQQIKAHVSGVLYTAASPGDPPFTSEGASIHMGDTLCIIEAMKTMHELKAPSSGKIAKVCVKNGAIVQQGDVIFELV